MERAMLKKVKLGILITMMGFTPSVFSIGECPGDYSPILVDLNKDGIHLGAPGVGVYFDFIGFGNPAYTQWVREGGDEAFLAIDLNGNGIVDDGSELFGIGTELILENNTLAPNGFVGLSQYDESPLGGNDDGYITQDDEVWEKLVFWLDSNADGISTEDEIFSLDGKGIKSLETIPRVNNRQDPAGNTIPLWAWAEKVYKNGKVKMFDVFFRAI